MVSNYDHLKPPKPPVGGSSGQKPSNPPNIGSGGKRSVDQVSFRVNAETELAEASLDRVLAKMKRIAELADRISGAGISLTGCSLTEPLGPDDVLVVTPDRPWTREAIERAHAHITKLVGRKVLVLSEPVTMAAVRRADAR